MAKIHLKIITVIILKGSLIRIELVQKLLVDLDLPDKHYSRPTPNQINLIVDLILGRHCTSGLAKTRVYLV